MSPSLSALLATLADLPDEVLTEVYNLDPECGAPLDEALFVWRGLGCPGAGPRLDNGGPAAPPNAPGDSTGACGAVYAVEAGPVEDEDDVRALIPVPGCGLGDWWCHGSCRRHGQCMYCTDGRPNHGNADGTPDTLPAVDACAALPL
jgi:hypothetical protein